MAESDIEQSCGELSDLWFCCEAHVICSQERINFAYPRKEIESAPSLLLAGKLHHRSCNVIKHWFCVARTLLPRVARALLAARADGAAQAEFVVHS